MYLLRDVTYQVIADASDDLSGRKRSDPAQAIEVRFFAEYFCSRIHGEYPYKWGDIVIREHTEHSDSHLRKYDYDYRPQRKHHQISGGIQKQLQTSAPLFDLMNCWSACLETILLYSSSCHIQPSAHKKLVLNSRFSKNPSGTARQPPDRV